MKDENNQSPDETPPENHEDHGEEASPVQLVTTKPSKPHFSILTERKQSSADSSETDGSPVHVVARVRPLNPQETARKDQESIEFPGNGGMFVASQAGQKKSFAFNAVFETLSTQKEVFENCDIQRLLDMAIRGYACTAFAFGQTGSGKSYTMTGPVTPEETSKQHDADSLRHPDNYGLMQYSFAYLIQEAFQKNDAFTMRASYMEIYNEQVQDLLNPYGYDIVQMRWSKSSGFYVENLVVREIETLDELMTVLEDGMKNRSVAAHNMNEHSSRSHSILTVHIDSEVIEEGISVTKRGKISFVDLAGSEKVKETGSTGDTLTEATNINRSLLTLGNCISALSDSKKRTGHIPFRDSKLTKLLADSLGGSGATLMIACVSPSSQNVSETLNTLRYAKRAKKIKNKPVVRMDPREALILKLQRDMNLIKEENVFLRRQLQFPHRDKPKYPRPGTMEQAEGQQLQQFLPQIQQQQRMNEKPMDRPTTENSLYGMLQEYMVENEALRNENQSLMTQHSNDEKDFRILSRENDRLSEKFEHLQRLFLSSPMVTNGHSRTNSGYSHLSLHSFDSSLTPISQTLGHSHPVFGPSGTNYPNYAINNPRHHGNPKNPPNYGPQVSQHPFQAAPGWEEREKELPPLKRSPPQPRRQPNGYGRHPGIQAQETNQSKWEKGRSYARQMQDKKAWYRINNLHGNNDVTKKVSKQRNDVMSDFPLRDLTQPRQQQDALHGQVRESPPGREFPKNISPVGQHPLHRHDIHPRREPLRASHPQGTGGALPQDAYRTRDLSPRSSTKELSATSLRRMNNKMRQEMRALDDQIHYERRIHKTIPSS
ncbi:kinesin-like protein KIF12 [Styela clava]